LKNKSMHANLVREKVR